MRFTALVLVALACLASAQYNPGYRYRTNPKRVPVTLGRGGFQSGSSFPSAFGSYQGPGAFNSPINGGQFQRRAPSSLAEPSSPVKPLPTTPLFAPQQPGPVVTGPVNVPSAVPAVIMPRQPTTPVNPFDQSTHSSGDCVLPQCKTRANCPVPKTENVPLFDDVCMADGTETPYTSEQLTSKGKGVYKCSCCGNPLFHSDTKYDSQTGWPSFWQPISEDSVDYKTDYLLGYPRTEVVCKRCGAHLGHVFPDGPWPTGKRYCMNGVCLDFDPDEHPEDAQGGHSIDYATIFSGLLTNPRQPKQQQAVVVEDVAETVEDSPEEIDDVDLFASFFSGDEEADLLTVEAEVMLKGPSASPAPEQQPMAMTTVPAVTQVLTAPKELPQPPAHRLRTAVLAGGCFWAMEMIYEHVVGVYEVVSGFAGGRADTAHYKIVTTGTTNHAEAVEILYDPAQISYEQLLEIFFLSAHDPTTLNYQHPDSGRYYRSAIFYNNAQEKAIAEAMIQRLTDDRVFWPSNIVTELNPLVKFYPAEDYHQDFGHLNPQHPYIQQWDVKKLRDLYQKFPQFANLDMDFETHYAPEPLLSVLAQLQNGGGNYNWWG